MRTIGSFCMGVMFVRRGHPNVPSALSSHSAVTGKKRGRGKFMALFNPSRDEVRRFFCDTWQKKQASTILTPLETLAGRWMEEHPEYHALLSDSEAALGQDYTPERGETNPFLHLSMHLSISEQISIDQPPGIRHVASVLAQRLDSEHATQHRIMECLGQVLWESQRDGGQLSPEKYLLALKQLI
jgi:hypothetical protein